MSLDSEAIEAMLRDALPFAPTESQTKAIRGLSMLMTTDKENPTLLIKGYAGTGKTALMRALCDVAVRNGFAVELMAPTGRAAKVLRSATGRPAHTIHRTIYRQQTQDSNSAFDINYNSKRRCIYVVDEASMISDSSGDGMFGSGQLLSDLLTYIFSQDDSRLVVVGDPAQLPPIGQNSAPALNLDYMRCMGLTAGHIWLTDIVRQKTRSAILENATSLREIIEKEPGFCGFPRLKAKEGSDVERIDGEGLIEALEKSISKYGLRQTTVITRSNRRATQFSMGIRGQIMYIEEMLTPGDLLIVTKNNYLWRGDNKKDFIANGDVAEVVRINGYEVMYGLHYADVTLRFSDDDGTDIDCKILTDLLIADAPNGNATMGKPLTTEEIYRRMSEGASEEYEDYTNERRKVEDMRKNPWLNALQVRYAYALTCHKAQGGQWKSVFLDVGYVAEEMMNTEYVKWLYTAMTRATRKLYLVNFKDEYFE